MKPGDVLWNGEALVSQNCQYKLILNNGDLKILDTSNNISWQQDLSGNGGERLEFRKDGNVVVLSYSNHQEILWQSSSSTLLDRDNINFANRIILTNDGEFLLTDNLTYNQYYTSSNDSDVVSPFISALTDDYNYNMICDSEKYQFIDKRYGFYATWISYFNCIDNEFVYGETTPCVSYKYCSPVYQFENIFLQPTSVQTNCRLYTMDEWRIIKNNYLLFQISFANTAIELQPKVFIILTTNTSIEFGKEFDTQYLDYRSLLVTISPATNGITLTTKNYTQTFSKTSLFYHGNYSEKVEWSWIEWDNNFDYIGIGNS